MSGIQFLIIDYAKRDATGESTKRLLVVLPCYMMIVDIATTLFKIITSKNNNNNKIIKLTRK